MTYISWRRDLIRSTIDQFIAFRQASISDQPATASRLISNGNASAYEDLLKQLNRSLPTAEITATLDDLLTAHRSLCTPSQLEVMEDFQEHLALAAA